MKFILPKAWLFFVVSLVSLGFCSSALGTGASDSASPFSRVLVLGEDVAPGEIAAHNNLGLAADALVGFEVAGDVLSRLGFDFSARDGLLIGTGSSSLGERVVRGSLSATVVDLEVVHRPFGSVQNSAGEGFFCRSLIDVDADLGAVHPPFGSVQTSAMQSCSEIDFADALTTALDATTFGTPGNVYTDGSYKYVSSSATGIVTALGADESSWREWWTPVFKPPLSEVQPKVVESLLAPGIGPVHLDNPRVVDGSGNVPTCISPNQKVSVSADLINKQSKAQAAAYVVQVTDGDGNTSPPAWYELPNPVAAGGRVTLSLDWTPSSAGTYTVELYAMDRISEGRAIAQPVEIEVIVDAAACLASAGAPASGDAADASVTPGHPASGLSATPGVVPCSKIAEDDSSKEYLPGGRCYGKFVCSREAAGYSSIAHLSGEDGLRRLRDIIKDDSDPDCREQILRKWCITVAQSVGTMTEDCANESVTFVCHRVAKATCEAEALSNLYFDNADGFDLVALVAIWVYRDTLVEDKCASSDDDYGRQCQRFRR